MIREQLGRGRCAPARNGRHGAALLRFAATAASTILGMETPHLARSSLFPQPKTNRIALVGDTHANTHWFSKAIREMAADGIDTIVQVGDFGWWPHSSFAGEVAHLADQLNVNVVFLDGNHEHHTDLRRWAYQADPGYEDELRPVCLFPSLWYLPRGVSWEWNGVKFRALGGAVSIDKYGRVPGVSWFDTEDPSHEEVLRTITAGPADVLLLHDRPEVGFDVPGLRGVPPELESAATATRYQLTEVINSIEPKLVVHGHWHYRYSHTADDVRIEGLDCDGSNGAIIVLDLSTLETEDWTPVEAVTR